MVLERKFQPQVIKDLKQALPGCIVIKNDPTYIQGFPDLLVLYDDKWAALEVKTNREAPHRPNQEFYVDLLDDMSFSSFVYPENWEEVLYEVCRALGGGR